MKKTTKNTHSKKKPGRPQKKLDIKKVRTLASQGLNQQQIADALGCNVKTLISRKRQYMEFMEAIEGGTAEGLASMTSALFESGLAGHFPAQRFYLMSRAPEQWGDRKDQPTSGEIKIVIDEDDAGLFGMMLVPKNSD